MVELNPDLVPSPFVYGLHPICCEIIKFRLGSHYLPIDTGRWNRTPKQERICTNCEVLGDEKHMIYNCALIPRNEMEQEICHLFKHIKINESHIVVSFTYIYCSLVYSKVCIIK